MSETMNEAKTGAAKLYDTAGAPLRASAEPVRNQADQLAAFVEERPWTAAMVALIVGYLLGKIT